MPRAIRRPARGLDPDEVLPLQRDVVGVLGTALGGVAAQVLVVVGEGHERIDALHEVIAGDVRDLAPRRVSLVGEEGVRSRVIPARELRELRGRPVVAVVVEVVGIGRPVLGAHRRRLEVRHQLR